MPDINIADERKRDAVVKAESVRIDDPVHYLGPKGNRTYSRRILKATIDHDIDALSAEYDTPQAIADALVADDPEVDIERFGQFLWSTSRVWIDPHEEMVFRVKQTERVRDASGKVIKERARVSDVPNVAADIPLRWTGRYIKKSEAVRRYVFSGKLQVIHVNGLTYDFLFEMAKKLFEKDSLMVVGAGKSGKEPLIFRRGSVPYRAFLEGRIDSEQYVLLLHLSNMELKVPQSISGKSLPG